MRIVHADDGIRVHLGPEHGDVVIDVPDNCGAPAIQYLNEPVVYGNRAYTHVLVIDEFPGTLDSCAFPLSMAEAMEIRREKKGRQPR